MKGESLPIKCFVKGVSMILQHVKHLDIPNSKYTNSLSDSTSEIDW